MFYLLIRCKGARFSAANEIGEDDGVLHELPLVNGEIFFGNIRKSFVERINVLIVDEAILEHAIAFVDPKSSKLNGVKVVVRADQTLEH